MVKADLQVSAGLPRSIFRVSTYKCFRPFRAAGRVKIWEVGVAKYVSGPVSETIPVAVKTLITRTQ